MSKGLEALEEIKKGKTVVPYRYIQDEYSNEINTIKKELRAGEIAINFIDRIADLFKEYDLEELEDKIIKTKKAFEIIKEKAVDIIALEISIDLKQYNCKEDGRCPLAQEEYILLKEVLL